MSRNVKVDARAQRDLVRILRWLHRRSPQGADSWHEAFWKAIVGIAEDAERFPIVEESHALTQPVRDALFKTRRGRLYRIIFDFSDDEVFILRVRRPGQRPLRRRDLP